jgi:hypothetical protein
VLLTGGTQAPVRLKYDFEVEVPTRTSAGGGGGHPNPTGAKSVRHPRCEISGKPNRMRARYELALSVNCSSTMLAREKPLFTGCVEEEYGEVPLNGVLRSSPRTFQISLEDVSRTGCLLVWRRSATRRAGEFRPLLKGGSVYEAGVSEEVCLLSSGYAPRRG